MYEFPQINIDESGLLWNSRELWNILLLATGRNLFGASQEFL